MATSRRLTAAAVAGIAAGALVIGLAAYARGTTAEDGAVFQHAVGSWFGRAVPVPGETICPPGAPGCPVPPEIVMIFTVHGDGTFIGIDSNIFAGGDHTTAHGQWQRAGSRRIKAEFTLLQSSPEGVFIGGFKNLFTATLVDRDEMQGSIDARLYSYTDATGTTLVDADGFPTPNPLAPAAECDTTPGCTHLGRFSFTVRRVKVN
jgi:hypothetical protein